MLLEPEAIRVSVVMPARNAGDTIARQLGAVVAQLGPNDELIVVDNASTDDTATVVDRCAATHPKVRRIAAPVPGVNRARNAGVAAARGRYVLLCDADDEVHPGWVSSLAAALGRSDLVGGRVRWITAGQPTAMDEVSPPREPILWDLASPWGCSCGFRREMWERVGGFDDRMSGGSDEIDFFLRAQLVGGTLSWADGTVDYAIEWTAERRDRIRRENTISQCRAYWAGRVAGRPRRGGMLVAIAYLAWRAPAALVSRRHRARWHDAARMRWWRIRGFTRFGAAELTRSLRHRSR